MNTKDRTDAHRLGASVPLAELCGRIERVTFSEADSGFTVAQVQVPGDAEWVTVVGNLRRVSPGVSYRFKGQWTDHPRYGRQFQALWVFPEIPTHRRGVIKYLGSGLIHGIGPKLAERIVNRFEKDTIDILDHHSHRLMEVNGIGTAKLKEIQKSWTDHKQVHDIMLFLQSHGVSPALADKIFKTYGQGTVAAIRYNPFQLAEDINGVGFLTADRIASRLGISSQAPQRIQAGLLHALKQSSEEGHVFYPLETLTSKVRNMLACDQALVASALERLAATGKIVIQQLDCPTPWASDQPPAALKAVYLSAYHTFETFIAQALGRLSRSSSLRVAVDTRPSLQWVQSRLKLQLAQRQSQAVAMALANKVMVITGGPGTGKTTIIRAIASLYERMGVRILLAAPTGRAAKRMSETTGHGAKTIHRLLEYSPSQGGFQRSEDHPLDCHLLIIDEVSMVDTPLMYYLLQAVPQHATLILVGDNHQLPSVGPGNVLHDIIASKTVPVVILDKIFRQAASGRIVTNAHRINNGQTPLTDTPKGIKSDFYFIEQNNPEKILGLILEITSRRIPNGFGLDAVDDIQVLTPMHKGLLGAGNLNHQLQQLLNPNDVYIKRGSRSFRLNDKVMQIRNNYTKEVFNGDIGRIVAIDATESMVTVNFDDRRVAYEQEDLEDLVLAYAVSIHKSQGSEYAAVVIPVTTQHFVMLQRNLLYTAVTRGKQLVVLVGDRRAMAIAVKNNTPQMRYTHLAQRLKEVLGGQTA